MNQFARVVVRDNDRFLVIHNIKDGRNRWEFPGGKVDANEVTSFAALRELKEEVGVDWHGNMPYIGTVSITIDGGDWVGDLFLAERKDIIGEPKIMEPHKFDGLKWVTIEEYSKLPQIPALGIDVARVVMDRL